MKVIVVLLSIMSSVLAAREPLRLKDCSKAAANVVRLEILNQYDTVNPVVKVVSNRLTRIAGDMQVYSIEANVEYVEPGEMITDNVHYNVTYSASCNFISADVVRHPVYLADCSKVVKSQTNRVLQDLYGQTQAASFNIGKAVLKRVNRDVQTYVVKAMVEYMEPGQLITDFLAVKFKLSSKCEILGTSVETIE